MTGLTDTPKPALNSTDQLGHFGEDGTIKVAVPSLKKALGSYGELLYLEDLKKDSAGFSLKQRKQVIDQLIRSLDEFYVHRDLKWARHAVDPGCALRALRRVVGDKDLTDLDFHIAVARIVKSLRDIHTAYVLPSPYRKLIAFLPFALTASRETDDGAPRIVVSDLLEDFTEGPFKLGAEILTWNGIPIQNAIMTEGLEECAANPAAQFRLGVRLMTIRWLGTSMPPEAKWVTLSYLDEKGDAREIRFSWRILRLNDGDHADMELPIQAVSKLEQKVDDGWLMTQAMDPRSEIESAAEYALFKSGADRADPQQAKALTDNKNGKSVARTIGHPDIPDKRRRFFRVTVRETTVDGKKIKFGHFRIYGFNLASVRNFVNSFREILKELPPDYLVLDIRSNPGGNLNIAECLVQLFTPRNVEPLPFQFRATREAERLVDNDGEPPVLDFEPWIEKVADAVANGQQYSLPGTLTSQQKANILGQEYFGNVALLIDGITYSSGDIFAAHFADLGIGTIFGTDEATGGGGGNMLYQGVVAGFAPAGLAVTPLPEDAHLHFAVRRFRRNGSDPQVEESGIKPEEGNVFRRTQDDLRNNDRRLLHRVVEKMATGDRRRVFKPKLEFADDALRLHIQTDTGDGLHPLVLRTFVDHHLHTTSPDRTDDTGRAIVQVDWDRKAPLHLRVEAYQQNWDTRGRPQQPTLVAVYKKDINKDGTFEAGDFS